MKHIPVLLNEVLDGFKDVKLNTFVDATLGAGGHAREILLHHREIKTFIGLDQDKEAIEIAEDNLSDFKHKLKIINSNFGCLEEVLKKENIKSVDGILFDVGVSSMQLDNEERGFSFSKDAYLDMRMDRSKDLTAEIVINTFTEKELEKIFWDYGEEYASKRIAKRIVEERKIKRITRTKQLSDLIIKAGVRGRKIHPATLTFQALRIFVNDELNVLEKAVIAAIDHLSYGGRVAVICFHSLEDRIVKDAFRSAAKKTHVNEYKHEKKIAKIKIITKKPIRSSVDEIKINPRSRSAKLRVAEKT